MRTNTTTFATTQFRVLSDDQIEQIFLGALEILESTGTRFHSEEALKIIGKAGAVVDGDVARIPAGLVREMLASVPQRVAVGNRDGERNLLLESHRIYYGTGSDCPFILDAKSGKRRQFLKKDVEDAARVLDSCDNMDFFMSLGQSATCPRTVTTGTRPRP